MGSRRRILACLGSGLLALVARAEGGDFRVVNKVFLEDEKTPISESITLFKQGTVYDFLQPTGEITVFDQARGRLIVLDPARKLRAEVSTEDIESFADQLRKKSRASKVPLTRFLADPAFEESYDKSSGLLELKSRWIEYRVTSEPIDDPEDAQRYAEFSDWQAQFNVLVHPSAPPPFARMALDEALRSRERAPKDVTRLISVEGKGQNPEKVRAEHRFQWKFMEADDKRMASADKYLVDFESVTMDEFHKRLSVASKP